MRSISTDGIEQVEIIRGIPSVEYGNLTSGIVKIKRKMGGNHFNARFKADESSKLVYLGKGFEFPKRQIKINSDIDWLDAKADPRDNLENYKRLTFSLRLEKTWKTGPYNVFTNPESTDYPGSIISNGNRKTKPHFSIPYLLIVQSAFPKTRSMRYAIILSAGLWQPRTAMKQGNMTVSFCPFNS